MAQVKFTKAYKYAYDGTRVVEFAEGAVLPADDEAALQAVKDGAAEKTREKADGEQLAAVDTTYPRTVQGAHPDGTQRDNSPAPNAPDEGGRSVPADTGRVVEATTKPAQARKR